MADYFGTDEDDLIDASQLDSDIKNINSGSGNDTITNVSSSQEVRSSEGNDNISGTNFTYRISGGTGSQDITVNLKDGISDDGFGTQDTISGATSIHTDSNHNTTIYGTNSKEDFWLNGGSNIVDGGGGNDRVIYYGKKSSDYSITLVGEEIHIEGNSTKDILTNVRYAKFWEDNNTIDLTFYSKNLKANEKEILHSFTDATMAPSYIYAGVEYPEKLVSLWPQSSFLLDINDDGIEDPIFPMSKGYGTGVDGTTSFIAFITSDGKLKYDQSVIEKMPFTTGARRAEKIQLVKSGELSVISVAHDTDEESERSNPNSSVPDAELHLILSINSTIEKNDIIPTLPDSNPNQPYSVDAHSMGVGDINGDGRDDVFVGNWSGKNPYELLQQEDGTFKINKSDFYETLINWPSDNSTNNLLIDAALADINGDQYADLIAGFGHGSTSSLVFINNNGSFNKDSYISLPDSIYGKGNQLHLITFPNDFDHDGDLDLAILWSRYEPYYAGNYIQILNNDGSGNFTDVTETIPENSRQDAYQSQWREPWQLYDVNNDNHMDIVGSRIGVATPVIYFNDGESRFAIDEIALQNLKGTPYVYGDFDNNKKLDFITFDSNIINEQSELSFYLYEMVSEIGTGPNYSIDAAEQAAPGFNEHYYLNENSSAKEAVDAGTYATGLEHYLAEGKEAGLKSFAPFTKVHGYSGNDTIILREGDEIAFGYAGKDTIEGGAGNDAIDGGAGVDTAIYKDASSAYTLTANDNGTVSVVHSSPSEGFTDEGTDTLTSIEKMEFSNKTLSKTSLKYELSESIDTNQNTLTAHSENAISGTLNFNAGDNIVILDGQGKNYRGLSGDDTYFVSQLIPKNTKLSITDTDGTNIIQVPANTYVDKSLFTKNAARLTLEDGREITINSADKFSYNVGGNVTNGTKGTDLTFAEFAEVFGVYDILNSSGAQTGTISDIYII